MSHPSIPSATYRLQFNKDFTFAKAGALADYLRELGVSHVYASPYFKASPGSTHGYDVTDHNALNPEVGSREEYDAYVAALKGNGLGQIVDFVPNHMGIGPLNPYWMDVLENGRGSKYAPFFDIDWHPLKEELAEKVLLPILGDQYGRVLEKGELKLNFEQGSFFLTYFETRLPINPRGYGAVLKKALELSNLPAEDEGEIEVQSIVTASEHLPHRFQTAPEKVAERAREKEVIKKRLERVCQEHPRIAEVIQEAVQFYNGKPGEGHSFDPLDTLIGEQAYRLSFWRVAAEEINYRRFFDINTLAAIKVEIPEVFERMHRLIFELIESGAVTGLRIDHVDGLWNPREYLEHLQSKYRALQIERIQVETSGENSLAPDPKGHAAEEEGERSRALAHEANMDFIELGQIAIPAEVISMISAETARQHRIIPVALTDTGYLIATDDPLSFDTFDAMGKLIKKDIDFVCATPSQIDAALTKYYDASGSASGCDLYLLVEKILMSGEKLRTEWPVHGTTGYDFTNQITEMLVDRGAQKTLTETYHRFIEDNPRFADLVYQKKQLTMQLSLASEVHVLAFMLNRLSEKNRWYRDFTLSALTVAVREVIACFPVYRTYAEPGRELSDYDRQIIDRAVRAARRRNPGMEASIFQFLRETLLLRFPENIDEADRAEHLRFVMKFQQCTGPITAKGIEDTAFYIYNRLAALNEVGGEPDHFGAAPDVFHKQNAVRLAEFPHSMLATSTHDTKRGEDVRARLAAISEIPDTWRRAVHRFRTANRKHKRDVEGEHAPDANEEYLIYQTLAGAWPLDGEITETFTARIQEYMAKAIKEAKVNSSWIQPNENWDTAVKEFIAAILGTGKRNTFPELFRPLAEQLAQLGAVNSLSQTLIKLTVPGVPDIYQGNEVWDLSLVDPDNRRPVDYEARRKALAGIQETAPEELLANWKDGRIKLLLTYKMLRFRREHFELFAKGDYVPVQATGAFAESVFAYARRYEGKTVVVIAPRLSGRVGFWPVGEVWGDTTLEFQAEGLSDLFTGQEFSGRVAESLGVLPFGAFVSG